MENLPRTGKDFVRKEFVEVAAKRSLEWAHSIPMHCCVDEDEGG